MTSHYNFLILLLLAFGISTSQAADQNYPLTKVVDKVHVIYGTLNVPTEKNRGFRNNPVIVQTSKGIVILDPGGSNAAGEMIINKIRSFTDTPIVTVFNSHAHGDHWLGNEAIKNSYPDAIIYGHKKMKNKVDSGNGDFWLDTVNRLTKGSANGKKVVSPDKTVSNGDEIKIGDTTFRIHHKGAAHTTGDIMVEIVEHKILYTGDIVRNGMIGIMEDGSSFTGNISAIDHALNLKANHYIPGHGKAGGAEIMRNYQSFIKLLYDDVKIYFEEGLSDFEMKTQIEKKIS